MGKVDVVAELMMGAVLAVSFQANCMYSDIVIQTFKGSRRGEEPDGFSKVDVIVELPMWLILWRVVLFPAVPLEYLAVCEHQSAGGQQASNDRQPHLCAEHLDKEEELSGGLLS